MRPISLLPLLTITCLLGACTSNQERSSIRLALTEMGNSSDSEYGAYGTRVQRVISISGLGAEDVVGNLTTDIDKWSLQEQLARLNPFRKDLPDALNLRLVSGQSFIVERSYDSNNNKSITQEALVQLAQDLEQYQALLAGNAHQSLNQAIQQLGNEKQLPQEKIASLLKNSKVSEIISDGRQREGSRDDQQNVESLRSKILDKLKHGGIMVMAWNASTRQSTSANAGTATSAEGSNQQDVDGFLVIGNPVVTTLFIGDDVLARATVSGASARGLFKTHRNYLTNFQLRAKHLVYAQSLSAAAIAQMQADIAQFARLAHAESKQLSAEELAQLNAQVSYARSSLSAIAGMGSFDGSKAKVVCRPANLAFTQGRAQLGTEIHKTKRTLPVISMRVALDHVINRLQQPNTPLIVDSSPVDCEQLKDE